MYAKSMKSKWIAALAAIVITALGTTAKAGGPTFTMENPECAKMIEKTIKGSSINPAMVRCAGPDHEGGEMIVYLDTPANRLTAGRNPFEAQGYVPIDYQTTFVYNDRNKTCSEAITTYTGPMDDKNSGHYMCYIDVDDNGKFVPLPDNPGNRTTIGAWTPRDNSIVPPKVASQLYDALHTANTYALAISERIQHTCKPIDTIGSEAVIYEAKQDCVALLDANVLMVIRAYYDQSCTIYTPTDRDNAIVLDCLGKGTQGVQSLIAMPIPQKSEDEIAAEVAAACGKGRPHTEYDGELMVDFTGSDKCLKAVRNNAIDLLAVQMDYVEDPETKVIMIRKPHANGHVPAAFFADTVAANK